MGPIKPKEILENICRFAFYDQKPGPATARVYGGSLTMGERLVPRERIANLRAKLGTRGMLMPFRHPQAVGDWPASRDCKFFILDGDGNQLFQLGRVVERVERFAVIIVEVEDKALPLLADYLKTLQVKKVEEIFGPGYQGEPPAEEQGPATDDAEHLTPRDPQTPPGDCPHCGRPLCTTSAYDPVAGDCDGRCQPMVDCPDCLGTGWVEVSVPEGAGKEREVCAWCEGRGKCYGGIINQEGGR